jgi:hypothetical protein
MEVFADQVLARQKTDYLADDNFFRAQPIQSPGGSLASFLGQPEAPQAPMDLDDLSNHDEADPLQE